MSTRRMLIKAFVLILLNPLATLSTAYKDQANHEDPTKATFENFAPLPEITLRLPTNVRPIRYELTLEPVFDDVTTFGSVIIQIQVLQNTKIVTLHKDNINIASESVTVENSSRIIPVKSVSYDYFQAFYHIHLMEELVPNENYTLTIGRFVASMSNEQTGFYLGSYTEQGTERYFALTQFERRSARKAFPCFDEPALKATFQINLIRDSNYTSISNEQLTETTPLENGKYKDRFQETIPMSTYVVAFVVSDFAHQQYEKFRIFTTRENIRGDREKYALLKVNELTHFMEKLLDVPYPLSKLDQVAIPNIFFAAGAMANFGLIIYRESSVLGLPWETTLVEKEAIAKTIVNEVSHQWFGNLVSIAWWDCVWLKEGFAAYFEYFVLSKMEPTWRMDERFLTDILQVALYPDSLSITQPLNYADMLGEGPPTILHLGASLLRMIEHFVTREVFQNALSLYLKQKQFGSATSSDFHNALQLSLVSHNKTHLLPRKSVASTLHPWENIAGYPIVTILRNYRTGELSLTQEHFVGDSFDYGFDYKQMVNNVWNIPINFATVANNYTFTDTTADFWLTEKSFTVPGFPTDGWLIANIKATGFYRVEYDTQNWWKLIRLLNSNDFNQIHVLNRAQLIDDAFNLARAGRIPYHIPFELSRYIARETEYLPFQAFFNAMKFLDRMLYESEEYTKFQEYIEHLLRVPLLRVGKKGQPSDSYIETLHRANIMKWSCRMWAYECFDLAADEISVWMRKWKYDIDANLQTPYLCAAMQIASLKEWEFVFYHFLMLDERNVQEKYRMIDGMACTRNGVALKRLLMKATDVEDLHLKYRWRIFKEVAGSTRWGQEHLFQFVKKHFEKVAKSVDASKLLHAIAEHYTTRKQLLDLKELMNDHKDYVIAFQWAINEAEKNLQWTGFYLRPIRSWLVPEASSFIQMIHKVVMPLLLVAWILNEFDIFHEFVRLRLLRNYSLVYVFTLILCSRYPY